MTDVFASVPWLLVFVHLFFYILFYFNIKSGVWYRFNDETTEKMKGKSLNLESEEDLHGRL